MSLGLEEWREKGSFLSRLPIALAMLRLKRRVGCHEKVPSSKMAEPTSSG